MHYNWHRHYDPTIGRYTQPDPLGFVDGPGVYGYALAKPVSLVDPLGLFVPLPPKQFFKPDCESDLAEPASCKGRRGLALIMCILQEARKKNSPPPPKEKHKHHDYPQEFRKEFEKRDIDIDKHLREMDADFHRQLHGNGPRGGEWNKAWRDYFESNPGATRADVETQLQMMLKDFKVP